jgi:hypothetical protein
MIEFKIIYFSLLDLFYNGLIINFVNPQIFIVEILSERLKFLLNYPTINYHYWIIFNLELLSPF